MPCTTAVPLVGVPISTMRDTFGSAFVSFASTGMSTGWPRPTVAVSLTGVGSGSCVSMQALSEGVVSAGGPKFEFGSNVSVPVARAAAVSTPSATVYVRRKRESRPAGRVTVMQLSRTVIV